MAAAWHPTRLFSLLDVAVEGSRVEEFGGRAPALVEAQRRGASVAETWILPAIAFRDAVMLGLPPGHDPASLVRVIHKPAGLERAARARERLLELELPEELRRELVVPFASANGADWGLSIRTSPTTTDDTLVVAAGLDAVIFGIRNAEALERAIKSLWALGVEEQALRYLRSRRQRELGMALVVQRVHPIDATGFLLPNELPAGLDVAESRLMAGAFGLGAPPEDGALVLDTLRVGVDGSVLARRIADKSKKLVVNGEHLEVVSIDLEARSRSAFSDSEIADVAQIGKKIDPVAAHEIEFWISRGTAAVVDVRRVRGDGVPEGGDGQTVWSRTGLSDLLPGVPTPLTASLIEDFCESSLRRALSSLGGEPPRGVVLVSRAHGRYYLNVTALVPAISGIPGIDAAVVLDLLRGADAKRIARVLEVRRGRGSLPALGVAAGRLLLWERRLEESMQRFERDAEQHRRWLSEMDLAILPDDSLVTTLRESHGFLSATGRMLLQSSIAALAAHLALGAAVARSAPESAGRVAQAIVAGAAELESARPAVAFAHVVEIMRNDVDARAALERGAIDVDALPVGPGRRSLTQWLQGFGDRGLGEVECRMPRFSESSAPLFALLRAGLAAPAGDPDQRLSRVRVAADRELAALEAHASQIELALVRTLLGRARALARLRERMRVWMARTIGMMRQVALEVDRRLRRLDTGLDADAAFFLGFRELLSATSRTRADLGSLVRMRRAAFERDFLRADPPETFVGVPPRLVAPPFDAKELHGASASSGMVTGRARLIAASGRGAESLLPGEILVMRTPDVALSPLFFWAGGLVADGGSALSHAAAVARELGLPAVLGVPGARVTIRDGELLRVDGDRGVVERLEAR